jgi:hypothetical protein
MGFCFYKPIIDNQAGTYRTDGMVSASMLSNVNEMYMGDQLVYPYTPFSSSGIVAWWRGDQNVVSSSNAPFSWTSSYSNTTSSFTLTASVSISGSDYYNDQYPPSSTITGSKHNAVYNIGIYAYADLNNIFNSSSNVTIVMAGRQAGTLSTPLVYRSWFGMTGDWNSYIGTSVQSISNTNYVLKRDEDVTPSVWFPQSSIAGALTALSYNGTTGDYSYYQFLNATNVISGSRAGASGRLGATQQFRIGGWDGTQSTTYTGWDIIVLDYIPSANELYTWGSFVANNYERIYLT